LCGLGWAPTANIALARWQRPAVVEHMHEVRSLESTSGETA
jgi:hypothetical protein